MRAFRRSIAALALLSAMALGGTAGADTPIADPVDQREARAAGVQIDPDVAIESARAATGTTLRDLDDLVGALEFCSASYCVATINAELDQLKRTLTDKLGTLDACVAISCTTGITRAIDEAKQKIEADVGPIQACGAAQCAELIQTAINDALPDISLCTSQACVANTVETVRRLAGDTTVCAAVTCAEWVLEALPDTVDCGIATCAAWLQDRIQDLQPAISTCNDQVCVADLIRRVEEIVTMGAPCDLAGCVDAIEQAVASLPGVETCEPSYCVKQLASIIDNGSGLGVCAHEDCVDAVWASLMSEVGNTTVCLTLCDQPLAPTANTGQYLYWLFDNLKDDTRRTACNAARSEVLRLKSQADSGYFTTMQQVNNATNLLALAGDNGSDASSEVRGTIRSEDGGPTTQGFVVLTLWPGPFIQGQVGHPVLATSALDSNGAFRLDPILPPAALDAAEDANGTITATITYVGDVQSASLTLPLNVVSRPGLPPVVDNPRGGTPIAISLRPGVFGVYCTDKGDPKPTGDPSSGQPSGGGGSSGSNPDPEPTANDAQAHSRCLPQHVDHEHWRNTITGEVNTAYDMTARYAYGYQKNHDSTISHMVKPPNGGWQIGGSATKKQGTGFEAVTPVIGESQSQYTMMVLRWVHEGDYRWQSGSRKGQPCSGNEQAYPDQFRGDLTLEPVPYDEGPSQNNRCKEFDQGHRIKMDPGGTNRRFVNNSHTYENAGTWMEVGYKARSGWSEDVWTRWRAGTARDRYWLCGRGASGFENWTRVFAGPSENR